VPLSRSPFFGKASSAQIEPRDAEFEEMRSIIQNSESPKSQEPTALDFTLRPHVDWISVGIALLFGLLIRNAHVHIPW
jgi:hypothetical protein